MSKQEYNFDFYPDCVTGVLELIPRKKLLKEFIQSQDEDYILALYDKMYGRVTDLRIEQNLTSSLTLSLKGKEEHITRLEEELKKLKEELKSLKP